MAKTLRTAAFVVGAVALVATGVGALAAAGVKLRTRKVYEGLAGEGAGAEMATFKAGGKKYRMVEEDAETASRMFVLPPASGKPEFAPAARVTRRVTLMRKAKGAGELDGGEEPAKTPGSEKKAKKKKRDNFTFPSISYYFHIPKIFLNFFPHTGKNRNRRKSNLLP